MSSITYTTTASDPELDAAFEQSLATARAGSPPLPHLIDGEPWPEGAVFERRDPCAPSRVVSSAYSGSAALVAQAVAAAHAAQRAWAARPLEERAEALHTMAAEISERLVEIAGGVSAETGKNRIEALPEVQEGA